MGSELIAGIVKNVVKTELLDKALELLAMTNAVRAMFIEFKADGAEEFINSVLEEASANKDYVKDLEQLRAGVIPQNKKQNINN